MGNLREERKLKLPIGIPFRQFFRYEGNLGRQGTLGDLREERKLKLPIGIPFRHFFRYEGNLGRQGTLGDLREERKLILPGHPFSSLSSAQSDFPSHFIAVEMQVSLLAHLNSLA